MKLKSKAAAEKKRILIVDDEPQVLEVFSGLLREHGYEVDTAEHALAAVAAVVRKTPHLILADIQMPVVGGMELAHELKSHIDSRTIPVIAFTGHDSPELREAARKAGYDGYLPKPIKPGVFVAQVAKLLGPS